MTRFMSLCLAGFFFFACGDSFDNQVEVGQTQVTVPLTVADITQVTATIDALDLPAPIVGNLVITGDVATGLFANIPAGFDRNITVEAFVGIELACSGSTSVEVIADTTVTANVMAQCYVDEPAGAVDVITDFNFPPIVHSVLATPSTVVAGGVVDLFVDATDDKPDPLAYAWTASDGTFSDPLAPATQWTAPALAGSYTIEITVTDSDGGTVVIIIIIIVS
jgi:hypothetical protein